MSVRGSADFTSYVVARWHGVVRTLVLMGHPPAEADAIAVDGLSRCVGDFDRERRESDVDVFVYRTVLGVRRRRHATSEAAVAAAPAASLPDLEDRIARLAELQAVLAGLPEDERAVEAMRLAAELSDVQIGEVLGERPMSWRTAAFDHGVTEAIAVRPAPVDEVLGREGARRRRRTTWTVGVAVALLVAGGVATWIGTRPPADDTPAAVVTESDNPADVAWYADRTLHLDEVTVEVSGLVSMVEVPDGVVYVDRTGRVVLADQRGNLTVLGHTDPDLPVVGNRERGAVGWLDVEGDVPALVAWDTLGGREVDRLTVRGDARPVALDQSSLYYVQDDESWSWDFTTGVEPGTEPGGLLLDVSSAVRVSEFSSTSLRIAQPLFDIVVTVPGTGAQVSPDGDFVLTRVDFTQPGEVRVYEAATGSWVASGLRPRDLAVAASLGDGHTVTYVVAHREQSPESGEFVRLSESGLVVLKTCDLDTGECETLTELGSGGGDPVLPG